MDRLLRSWRKPQWVGRRLFRVSTLLLGVALIASILVAIPGSAFAQSKTVWDGAYTAAQATRGAASFATYCARCHGASSNDGEEGRSLAGDPFWKSFRESTVDQLLEFVSLNMPNSAGGSLSANVYADVVAFILSRNDLPPGTTELTKESAVGVKIITKDGPGELPGGTLVQVVGCVAAADGGGWLLNTATEPERTTAPSGEDPKTRALGTRSYRLMYLLTPLTRFVGHRMSVRGLLIGDGGKDGINVSLTQSLSDSCS